MNELSFSMPILQKYEEYCGKDNIPGSRKQPYFRNDDVLDEGFLAEAQSALTTIPGQMRANGVMKDYVYIGMANLTFDDTYGIVDTEYLVPNPIRYYGPDDYKPSEETISTIGKLREDLVQQFAQNLELRGTHKIWMNCFGYKLKEGKSVDPLPWHDDLNDSWTGVTLLTDPNSAHGWLGGNLQLAPAGSEPSERGPPKIVPLLDQRVEILSRYNSTIFFHNYGTKHTVTSMEGRITEMSGSGLQIIGDLFSERIIWCIEDHCRPSCREMRVSDRKCTIC